MVFFFFALVCPQIFLGHQYGDQLLKCWPSILELLLLFFFFFFFSQQGREAVLEKVSASKNCSAFFLPSFRTLRLIFQPKSLLRIFQENMGWVALRHIYNYIYGGDIDECWTVSSFGTRSRPPPSTLIDLLAHMSLLLNQLSTDSLSGYLLFIFIKMTWSPHDYKVIFTPRGRQSHLVNA